jgi:putative hemolysin
MSSISLEILVILLLLAVNGLFAMSEIAVVSARKARLQKAAGDGDKRAQAALDLANAPSRFLSTIQLGMTLVGVLAGAFGGTTIARTIAPHLETMPFLSAYHEVVALGLVVVAITLLSLIFGELVPKRLALHSPEKIAAAVAGPMGLLSRIGSPIVRLLVFVVDGVLRLAGIKSQRELPVTEEEFKILIDQGTEAGTFKQAERDMVQAVFRLGDRRVASWMKPRTEIVWLDVKDPPEVVRRKVTESVHTTLLVAEDRLDNLLGVVHAKDLLAQYLSGNPLDLRALLQQPLVIPENTSALNLLESFKQSGTHIAAVVDEHGGVQGVVTVTDVLEAIVGDISSFAASSEPTVVQREDGSWLLDGMLSIEELRALLRIPTLPGEQEGYYHTLAGFVMLELGHIPSAADHFQWGGFRFEVMDMDGRRVDKVLVAPVPEVTTTPGKG